MKKWMLLGQKSCCTTIRNTIIIKSYRAAKYTAGFPNHKDQQIGEIYEIKKSIRTDFIIRRSSRITLQADRREAYPARREASAGKRADRTVESQPECSARSFSRSGNQRRDRFPPGKRKILKRTARPRIRETYRKSQQKSGTLFHAGSL